MGFEFHLALSAAARDLGIRAVDVQHGLQTGWGPLYKWWEEIPPVGYNTLPTDFLVWGQRDKQHLEKEIALKNKSNVHVIGFPWIKKQFDFTDKLNSRVVNKLDDYKVKVLISLQHQDNIPLKFIQLLDYSVNRIKQNLENKIDKLQYNLIEKRNESKLNKEIVVLKEKLASYTKIESTSNEDNISEEEILKLEKDLCYLEEKLEINILNDELNIEKNHLVKELEYIKDKLTEEEILWIFRKHPKGKNLNLKDLKNRKNVLISNEIDNVQIGELLQKVDIHITSSSTVVIEADYFGVHNFIADEDSTGIENYQEEVDEGIVQVLEKPRDFYEYLWNTDLNNRSTKINA
ncbi:MAG: hypothetical protein IE909_19080, partial [Campylobacterales bacterium]|nr:hypothetical protein [Campylobacterales bacterium]